MKVVYARYDLRVAQFVYSCGAIGSLGMYLFAHPLTSWHYKIVTGLSAVAVLCAGYITVMARDRTERVTYALLGLCMIALLLFAYDSIDLFQRGLERILKARPGMDV